METVFVTVPAESLQRVLEAARDSSPDFALDPCWADDRRAAAAVPSIAAAIDHLRTGGLANFIASWTAPLPSGFGLGLSLLVDAGKNGAIDVDAIWWAEDVFPHPCPPGGEPSNGRENEARFREVLDLFLALGESLGSPPIYLGPESPTPPPGGAWRAL